LCFRLRNVRGIRNLPPVCGTYARFFVPSLSTVMPAIGLLPSRAPRRRSYVSLFPWFFFFNPLKEIDSPLYCCDTKGVFRHSVPSTFLKTRPAHVLEYLSLFVSFLGLFDICDPQPPPPRSIFQPMSIINTSERTLS